MIPYADFLYFGILLYVLVPSVLSGWIARPRLSKSWIVLATLLMLLVQYSQKELKWGGTVLHEIDLVAGFALMQGGLAHGFLAVRRRRKRQAVFYATVLASLVPLAVAKFVPLFSPHLLIGFMGISYVSFRSLDVIINIQDGTITELELVPYLAFLVFFPTISAGPIDRYRRFLGDWHRKRSRAEFMQDLDGAVQRVFRGFLYKFIIAALVKRYWLDAVSHGTRFLDVLSYMYAYSAYLFFDFAGYSAFAVGVSYLLGIHTPENFNKPFLARNIRDFWDRWHISLSWWFRDHVYTRFVFAAAKGRWFKNRVVASYLGFFLSMGLMGLWHGTAWFYLVYGLYHATLLTVHDVFVRWNRQHKFVGTGRFAYAMSVVLTFNAVCFGLLLFSGRLAANPGGAVLGSLVETAARR